VPIKAVVMDVDGVLTDGTVWLDEGGHELKRVCFADIMGVSLGRRAGLLFALISGEGGPALDRIAAKFGIGDVYADCKDKGSAFENFARKHDLALDEICFIGDDVNDLPAFERCGLAVAPAGAHPSARDHAQLVTEHGSGAGAVREVIDRLCGEIADRSATPDPGGRGR
jgi:3-deoxy-D-manno-octulosonate 8-phosphate phosphatase (KDO 8-P phosphatase)